VNGSSDPGVKTGSATGARTARVWPSFPGVMLCVTIAMASGYMAEQYGGPQVLYALLIGLALHTIGSSGALAHGINFASTKLLRLGVALLGARITLPLIFELGPNSAALIAIAVCATITVGWLTARALRMPFEQGIVSGGAVAICGFSAALAIASILPRKPETERFTLMVAAGVTLMSTIAMIIYPLIATALGFSVVQSGLFLGGSIHEVAQVVAAGMMLSQETADSATVVKIFRVALLVPVVLALAVAVGVRSRSVVNDAQRPPLLPAFLLAFCVLAAISSAGYIPDPVIELTSAASSWLLVIAIAAVGLKSSPMELMRMGWAPGILLVVETLFIAAVVLAGTWLLPA
jgi:uncharacterized integral membrane protein (TIGR00698 family)